MVEAQEWANQYNETKTQQQIHGALLGDNGLTNLWGKDKLLNLSLCQQKNKQKKLADNMKKNKAALFPYTECRTIFQLYVKE